MPPLIRTVHQIKLVTAHTTRAIGVIFDKKAHISNCFENDDRIYFKQINLMIF